MRTLCSALLLCALAAPAVSNAGDKPNVVLVVWDATRPDHLTPYGYKRDTTPNLGKLAEQSLVFEQAVSAAPWTLPSVASLFTGLFNHNHGVDYEATDFSLTLRPEITTLAEVVKGAGYRTALWSSQPIYMKQEGFLQGFDQQATQREVPIGQFHEQALAFMDAGGGKPTFTMLYYLDPHAPYEARPEHDLWVDKAAAPVNIRGCPKDVDPSKFPPGSVGHCDVNDGKVTLQAAQMQQLRDRYDGELHQNDALLGKLIEGLRSRNLLENTVIIFTSDHGEAFGEHADERVWHRLPYDSILRVPLIVRLPGMAGRRVKTAVRSVDVLPTVAQAVGATLAQPVNGVPLQELAKKDGVDRPALGTSHFAGAPMYLRADGYKLMASREGQRWTHVFDLKADPAEANDLSAQPGLVEKLLARREEILKQTTLGAGTGSDASQEELERLRALGYVD
jgi:arylsulfatase A-like enzyme